MFLVVTPSTRFEHLVVRSGRIVTVLSLSVKFVVDLEGNSTNKTQCIEDQDCVVACDLNMTIPLSLALKASLTTITAMLHSASFY